MFLSFQKILLRKMISIYHIVFFSKTSICWLLTNYLKGWTELCDTIPTSWLYRKCTETAKKKHYNIKDIHGERFFKQICDVNKVFWHLQLYVSFETNLKIHIFFITINYNKTTPLFYEYFVAGFMINFCWTTLLSGNKLWETSTKIN